MQISIQKGAAGFGQRLSQTLGCLLLAGWACTAVADVPGQLIPQGNSPHMYYVKLEQGALTNIAGSKSKVYKYNLGRTFTAYTQCEYPGQTKQPQPFLYTALTALPLSDIYGHEGYRKLNEYIDVLIELHIAGQVGKVITAPFYNYSNGHLSTIMSCNSANPPTASWSNVESSSKGEITFRLRKPIINGVTVNSREIIQMFGVMDMPNSGIPPIASTPIAKVVIETALLTVPDKCVVNNGREITVDFKDIPQTQMDGSRYVESIPVSYQCSGGSFSSGMKGISIGVSARPASFNDKYIDTTSDNLGIVLKHKGKIVEPNKFTKMPANQTNSGNWDLTAAPITYGSDIPLGDFTANGTIVMEFTEVD